MKARDFSYGSMMSPLWLAVLGNFCMLAFVTASAWLVVHGADEHARTIGRAAFVVSLALLIFGCAAPFFVRWAMIVRVDEWGVWLPARFRPEQRSGLPWEQIADVRVLPVKKTRVVVLIPRDPSYLNPSMKRFGFYVLPPVNVAADRLKTIIDEEREARVQTP